MNVSLLADGADAITNGLKYVFGEDFKHGMCWFHMRKAVDKELTNKFNETIIKEILGDIDNLQLSQSNEIFKSASKCVLKNGNYTKLLT